eukprot:5923809-Amphidinium_carterae.2
MHVASLACNWHPLVAAVGSTPGWPSIFTALEHSKTSGLRCKAFYKLCTSLMARSSIKQKDLHPFGQLRHAYLLFMVELYHALASVTSSWQAQLYFMGSSCKGRGFGVSLQSKTRCTRPKDGLDRMLQRGANRP